MKTKGFTLIELLVVIAIIGILSSVVLASLTTARTRGQAASVQSQLSNMRAQAELYYSTNGNDYGASVAATCDTLVAGANIFGTDTNSLKALVNGVIAVVSTPAKVYCSSTGTTWAVAAIDPSVSAGTQAFCVDSTGASKTVTGVTADTASTALTSGLCN